MRILIERSAMAFWYTAVVLWLIIGYYCIVSMNGHSKDNNNNNVNKPITAASYNVQGKALQGAKLQKLEK